MLLLSNPTNLTLVGLHPESVNFLNRLWICYLTGHHSWGKILPGVHQATLEARVHVTYIDSKICIHTTSSENKGELSCRARRKTKKKLATVAGIMQWKYQVSFSGNLIESSLLHCMIQQVSRWAEETVFVHFNGIFYKYVIYILNYFSHCNLRNMTATRYMDNISKVFHLIYSLTDWHCSWSQWQ